MVKVPKQFQMSSEKLALLKELVTFQNVPSLAQTELKTATMDDINDTMIGLVLDTFCNNVINVNMKEVNDTESFFVGYFQVEDNKLYAMIQHADKPEEDKVEVVAI